MAQPPSTKKIVAADLPDDWPSARDSLLPQLNKHISDVNDALTGGVSLVANAGCQVNTFNVQVPSNLVAATPQGSWTSSTGVGYRVDPAGNVWVDGIVTGGSAGSVIVKGLPAPAFDRSYVTTAVSAYASLTIRAATGNVEHSAGSTINFWVNFSYRPAMPLPWVPACFPVSLKCTLPMGQCLDIAVGQIVDVTPNSTPLIHGATEAVWHNSSGSISIDNIPGLLPGRTYSITTIAYPKG